MIRHCTVSCPTHGTVLVRFAHEDGKKHDHEYQDCGETAQQHLDAHPDCVLTYTDETDHQRETRLKTEREASAVDAAREAEAIRERARLRAEQEAREANDRALNYLREQSRARRN